MSAATTIHGHWPAGQAGTPTNGTTRQPQSARRSGLEEGDLERLGGQRLVAHQDDVDGIAERRAEDRGAAEQRVAAEVGPRLAERR